MSKKLACGADAIVIDMKFGKGAYMKDLAKARRLGQVMINIGEKMNRQVVVLITAMDQPLGFAVGNALEIKEAIATLQGQGPDDVMELCLELGANMLLLAKKTAGIEQGRVLLRELVKSGAAFNKFKTLIKSQGGELSEIEDTNLLPSSQHQQEYVSKKSGYVVELNALEIGKASVVLGAGRETKESKIDLGVGILLKKKIGDYVHKGENLAILYSEDVVNFKSAETHMNLAYRFANEAPILGSIIYETMR
jgi:pyrimidine-nucleoside phosphorylase